MSAMTFGLRQQLLFSARTRAICRSVAYCLHSMSITSIELYDALILAGVDKDKAEKAATAVISREEAAHLATKADIETVIGKIEQSRAEIFKFMALQTLTIVAGVVGLLQIIG